MKLIDFHSHIIPRADHGSSSVETSLFQLNSAAESGISRVIATPHFYPQQENVSRFISRRNECYDRLKEYITADLPEITLGAEVLICDNIESMPGLERLCIEGTRILLLELPFTDFSDSFVYSVKKLIKDGYTVVLAHADRYNPSNIDRLVSAGALIQLNVDSLSHLIVPAHIKNWVAADKVVALGSDIHGPDKLAYKRFMKALKHLGEAAEHLTEATVELINSAKLESPDHDEKEPEAVSTNENVSESPMDAEQSDSSSEKAIDSLSHEAENAEPSNDETV